MMEARELFLAALAAAIQEASDALFSDAPQWVELEETWYPSLVDSEGEALAEAA